MLTRLSEYWPREWPAVMTPRDTVENTAFSAKEDRNSWNELVKMPSGEVNSRWINWPSVPKCSCRKDTRNARLSTMSEAVASSSTPDTDKTRLKWVTEPKWHPTRTLWRHSSNFDFLQFEQTSQNSKTAKVFLGYLMWLCHVLWSLSNCQNSLMRIEKICLRIFRCCPDVVRNLLRLSAVHPK